MSTRCRECGHTPDRRPALPMVMALEVGWKPCPCGCHPVLPTRPKTRKPRTKKGATK